VDLPINSIVIFHSYVSLPEGIYCQKEWMSNKNLQLLNDDDFLKKFHQGARSKKKNSTASGWDSPALWFSTEAPIKVMFN